MIAGLSRSLVHTLQHHYGQFVKAFNITNHQWWNPGISWENKYKKNEYGEFIRDKNGDLIRNGKLVQFSDAFHTFGTVELGAEYFLVAFLLTILAEMILFIHGWILIIVFAGVYIVLMLWRTFIWFNLGYDKLWR